jgi:hypothetical protein
MENAYKILVGKFKGNRSFRKPKCRLEDNIRMDLRKIGLDVLDWINLVQDTDQRRVLLNMAMHLRVLSKAGSFLTS